MHYPVCIWSVLVSLTLLKSPDAVIARESKKNLHHHMTKREIEYYFGVSDHSEIPEYDVRSPHQTDVNGRILSRFRRRRSVDHPDVLHYNLHAFGSKLQLRLKRNLNLMAPNLVIERHHRDGVVTTQPAPRNKYYLGKVASDPDSLVALRSDRGLSGMIRTSGDTLFVQPLPLHLAKRVRRSADTMPHLIYRLSPGKTDAPACQTKSSGSDRLKRSTQEREPRATSDDDVFKFLEAALIVPKSYEEKYGTKKFATVLLVIGNMVAGMFQDPSIGKIRVYYVVTKIIVIDSIQEQAGFNATDSNSEKLNKMVEWTAPSVMKDDKDPDHYDVFSYVSKSRGARPSQISKRFISKTKQSAGTKLSTATNDTDDKIHVGGLALANHICTKRTGNVNADLGLQTALHIAHEIGHNLYLDHDDTEGCHTNQYIMAATLPSGVYAALWSNCSRKDIQEFLEGSKSKCLDDSPLYKMPTLSPEYHGKLAGEIFSGDDQCEMQYGSGWKLSSYKKGVCGALYCLKDNVQLSRKAPVADGSPCGDRDWCIGGKCVDNGRPRIHGGWSAWSSVYSSCTRLCGGGVQFRTRVCKNPVPSNGGDACTGADKDWRICNFESCEEGTKTFREEQCLEKVAGSIPYNRKNASPCALWCRKGSSASSQGTVKDGTRCTNDISNLDVCVQGICRPVGCDHVLDSNKKYDRCGNCGGDGDKCLVVLANYTNAHTEQGRENGDLIVRLAVGTINAGFLMRKVSYNYLGVQADNGTYLVGGGRSSTVQVVKAANTVIKYTRKKARYKDDLKIEGPTNAFLRVMYVFDRGANPVVDFSFTRPVQPSETPPESKYEWINGTWSDCSTKCGQGVRTRSVRCVRSDDKTPASDGACGKKIPAIEPCQTVPCPSAWYKTPWSDCSKSCGRGVQTRGVFCRMKINPTEYGPSTNCSADDKPIVNDTRQYCNSIACLADWDTKDRILLGECGKPYKKNDLKCYRTDQFGERAMIPNILCRYRVKPTRLPCTTPSISTTPLPTTKQEKARKKSQSIQAQGSMFVAFMIPLLQVLLEHFISP